MTESRNANNESRPDSPGGGWSLLRDVLVFQFKLVLDGLRDLLLSPASIIAVLAGYLLSPSDPSRFYRYLMSLGLRSDHFINLFGAASGPAVNVAMDGAAPGAVHSTDSYIRQLEERLLAEYEKGGLVTDVKDGTDELVRRLRRRGQKRD